MRICGVYLNSNNINNNNRYSHYTLKDRLLPVPWKPLVSLSPVMNSNLLFYL